MQEILPSWPIIDFHAHFPLPWRRTSPAQKEFKKKHGEHKSQIITNYSIEDAKRRRAAWCNPEPEAPIWEWNETAERWAREVEKYGLHRVVFVTGGENDLLAEIVRSFPDKFVAFAHHEPWVEGAGEELDRAVLQLNMRGFKMLAPLCPVPLEELTPVWDAAERHQIPVLIHFVVLGSGGGIGHHANISPLALHNVAKAYPTVPFIVPHFGCGYPKELLQLCWVCPNVHVDTSSNNQWINWMPYDLTLDDLFRRFYETVGPQRILFGTDSSWFPRGFAVRYLLDQIRACYKLRIPESDMRQIFGGNAARLLDLDLE
jgi:uncharacterized protein